MRRSAIFQPSNTPFAAIEFPPLAVILEHVGLFRPHARHLAYNNGQGSKGQDPKRRTEAAEVRVHVLLKRTPRSPA